VIHVNLVSSCNLSGNFHVQSSNRSGLRHAILTGLVGLIAISIASGVAGAAPSALESAEEAVRQLQAGDAAGAAVTTRKALDAEPGDTLLHNLAATLLMVTGDTSGATSEWSTALKDMPGDSLALYGMGLTSLAKGDRVRALDQFQVAERSGDRAACIIAQRYVESLNGSVGAGAGLTLPDAYQASALGLSGLSASRTGDWRKALSDIGSALAALPGDPYIEPAGLVMTFDKASALGSGTKPLPQGNGLAASRGRSSEKVYSGVVTLAPDDAGPGVGFVVFKVDGGLTSVVNTYPFRLVWDTAKAPNGLHKVEIVVYDKNGQIADRASRELRTANQGAPAGKEQDVAREERVRAALWQALILRPSRHTLAYAAAAAARAAGENAVAERYFEQAAAIEPGYRDTRAQWVSLTRCVAEPALWRGALNDNVVALTFDDGPKPGITELLLSVLQKESVPATFFVIGRHATAYPDLAKKIADAGMQIENHTYTHPNLTMLSPQAIERELVRTLASVKAATGQRMRFFRPPGGNINPEVTRIAAQWGLTPCMWTVDGEALENGHPQRLVDFVVQRATPGSIILLHNGRMTTAEALPNIIAGLRRKGFRFVTIDQLVERKRQMAGAAPR
jgi:peptidoglycan-N-acetylglucosamine deacetylase